MTAISKSRGSSGPLLMFFLAGCVLVASASCSASKPIVADTTKLSGWTSEAQDRLPEPPFVVRYAARGKRLTYVASRHENATPNATFALIEQEFKVLRPQRVIIEGLRVQTGVSPILYIAPDGCAEAAKQGVWPAGEAMFAACLALEYGADFIGGEPGPSETLALFRENRLEARDLLYYTVVRQIGQWRRTGEGSGRPFAELFHEFIGIWAPVFGLSATVLGDLKAFEVWYQKNAGVPFDYETHDLNLAAPVSSPDASGLQRMSSLCDRARDASVVRTAASALSRFDRVLVVYGAGHFVSQKAVFDAMLGKPISD